MNIACSQKMPHMQMRELKENHHVLSREPLMNQKKSIVPQMIIKSGDRFEDGKKSPAAGRRNGRRRGREYKVDGKKLDPSLGTSTPCNKSLMFHTRPGFGQLGTMCMVKANHFLAQIPGSDLSHYTVSFLFFFFTLERGYCGLN